VYGFAAIINAGIVLLGLKKNLKKIIKIIAKKQKNSLYLQYGKFRNTRTKKN